MAAVERDESLHSACFAHLRLLEAAHGPELPGAALAPGFAQGGQAIKFLNPQKGIHRSSAHRGRAALSVMTSFNSPYDDEVTLDGFLYAYRAGSADQAAIVVIYGNQHHTPPAASPPANDARPRGAATAATLYKVRL